MAKIKVAIIEADDASAKSLQAELVKVGFDVVGAATSAANGLQILNTKFPDIVLINANIKGELNGTELAKVIKENIEMPVIFLSSTTDKEVVDEMKEATAYGFSLKPYNINELKVMIEIAVAKFIKDKTTIDERNIFRKKLLEKESCNFISVRAEYRIHKINFKDIYYIEAVKDYITIHTLNASYTTHATMKKILDILPKDQFVRIHRSYIVKIDKIKMIKYPDLELEDMNVKLQIGGLFRKELFSKLNLL